MAPTIYRSRQIREPSYLAPWRKHTVLSDLVNHESPSMSAAAESQSQNPAAATLRPRLSSSAHTGMVANLRGSSTKQCASYNVSKPLNTRGNRRPELPVPMAPAQHYDAGSHASTVPITSLNLQTSTRTPGRHGRPTDCVPRTTDLMLQRLDEYFHIHSQELNDYDISRRILLREAIQNNDFFYLVLSQASCLLTGQNPSMAELLEDIPPESWSSLGTLLCFNKDMSEPVVKWFAEFPAPVEDILCSEWSQSFLKQLDIVKRFLCELPHQWNSMRNASISRRTPPLTQEMVEVYNLISPVIQTTVFRAMARSFWGADDPGLSFLVVLHKLDQDTYTKGHWKRTEEENVAAYRVLQYVFDFWQKYQLQPGARTEHFMLQNAHNFFRELPPSMQPMTDFNEVDGGNGHFSRGTAKEAVSGGHGGGKRANNRTIIQAVAGTDNMGGDTAWREGLTTTQQMQMQTVSVDRRIPRPSAFVSDQQRRLLRTNNSAAAQQLLSQNSRQHQPMQLHPSQLGSLSHSILPPRGAVPSRRQDMPGTPNHRPSFRPPRHSNDPVLSDVAWPRSAPVQPDTARVPLHQAHLRSPIPGNRQLLADSQPLYRHVTGYALAPTLVNSELYAQQITLPLSQVDLVNVPRTSPDLQPGEPGIRTLKEGSILYRLRCCKMPLAEGFDTEASSMTAVNTWPDMYTFNLNGTYLEPRRKLHHGQCLPIDLSAFLRVGSNTLSVYTVPDPSAPSTDSYVVAIEQVSVWSHASIFSAIKLISAENSLAAIKRSLENPPDEDDEISITLSTLTIMLFEPYRNHRICNTPVRGSACLHRECFDLETFLSQRKREQPGYPCVPDCWYCPICKGDVRPQTLVKDGFLVQVKEELVRKGLPGTRAIIVEADGSWTTRIEAQLPEVRTASLGCEEAAAAPAMMNTIADSRGSVSAGRQGKSQIADIVVLD